ncbi:MAG: hypothetical protein ACRD21_14195, partial [Vicinamibacteria bacterium]
FRTLADALAAQGEWAPSRKAYRRSFQIAPGAEIPLLMAEHPDLSIEERVDLLLGGYLASKAGAARSAIESKLLETGAFSSRDALKASLDEKRFPALQAAHPDLELVTSGFPDFQAVTDGGPFIPSQLFRLGTTLVVYFPADGCGRCSEELDGITLPLRDARKRGQPIEAAAFVLERELDTARTIARLLAMPVRVGRKDALPASLTYAESGEIRVVARGGLTSIRIPMTDSLASLEIRRRMEAILAFLAEPGLPTEARPEDASRKLVTLARGDFEERTLLAWIDTIEKLEVGPAPLGELYSELTRLAQRVVPDGSPREEVFQRLEALSRLRGANVAKTRLLGLASDRIGEKLLEHAKSLDPSIRRTPSGEEGVFHLAVSGTRRIYLQRSFASETGLRPFDFVLEDDGGSLQILWGEAQEKTPLGVESVAEGAAFFFACEAELELCRGARLVVDGQKAFEGERVAVIGGRLVALENALVDEPHDRDNAPVFYRPVVGGEEKALQRGLRLFGAGDYAGAGTAFAQAEKEIDPVAPYDASDLAYNRARAMEGEGKRGEALALFRSLGDVSYQSLVDERARLIESGR